MERLGQYLRSERDKRGMSLEEVAARTRIRLQTLEALERDDYPLLPPEVTVKGFLRSYSRCLGLNEQEVLARYQRFAGEYFHIAPAPNPVGPTARSARPPHTWQHKLMVVGLTVAGLMVVISGVVALGPRNQPEHPTAISAPMQVPYPSVAAPALEPSAEEPAAVPAPDAPPTGLPSAIPEPATTAPREAARPQHLALTATETSWVQVTIDNGETKEALLQPGQRVGWTAEQGFKLTVGNAGGVTVELNGELLPAMGPSGSVRTIVLPRVAMNTGGQGAGVPLSSASPAPAPRAGQPPAALTSPPDSTTVPPPPPQ